MPVGLRDAATACDTDLSDPSLDGAPPVDPWAPYGPVPDVSTLDAVLAFLAEDARLDRDDHDDHGHHHRDQEHELTPALAPDSTVRATRHPRPSRVLSPLIALACAALVVVGVTSTGPASGGPVDVGTPSGVVVRSHPGGSTITFGMSMFAPTSTTETIELVAIEPLLGSPAPEVAGDAMLTTRSAPGPIGTVDIRPGRSPVGPDLVPVAGHHVPPGRAAVEVAVPLVVPEEGATVLDGFTITYRVDGTLYRERSNTTVVLCPAEAPHECLALEARL